jgi:hypothetical protein
MPGCFPNEFCTIRSHRDILPKPFLMRKDNREERAMPESTDRYWIAPSGVRLPDFMICGAMKCGTSTVHALLDKHPQVFIPGSEINFFDIDDLLQHPDFILQGNKGLEWPNISKEPQRYWDWYQSFFENAPGECIWGEDSTTYVTSSKASRRISLQSKPVKTVICLRQPSQRAYSQYWHMLRTGRAIFTFEDTIRFTPHYVLERSMYLSQLKKFLKFIPRERVFFFILEQFLSDKEKIARELAEFLSLDFDRFPEDVLETHANVATFPRSIRLQILKNRMVRSFGNRRYLNRLPYSDRAVWAREKFMPRVINSIHNRINRLERRPAPIMKPQTKIFLDDYFRKELQGLGDIVGVDLDRLWFQE